MFMQHCYPRISKDSLLPVATEGFSPDTKHLWYPPGHGDIYASLFRSGLLENLINQGKEYIFISNIDNLSATVDMKVLYHLMNHDTEFCMEVVPKTRADTVGGTLVEYKGQVSRQNIDIQNDTKSLLFFFPFSDILFFFSTTNKIYKIQNKKRHDCSKSVKYQKNIVKVFYLQILISIYLIQTIYG